MLEPVRERSPGGLSFPAWTTAWMMVPPNEMAEDRWEQAPEDAGETLSATFGIPESSAAELQLFVFFLLHTQHIRYQTHP